MFDIGLRVREMRMEAGLTQQNIADLLMWDITKVSKIENGKQKLYYEDYLLLKEVIKAKKVDKFTVNDYDYPALLQRA